MFSSRYLHHDGVHSHNGQVQRQSFFTHASPLGIQQKKDTPFFQAKLSISKPNDKYEQEADAVANSVVNHPSNIPVVQQKKISSIQRLSSSEEEKLGTNEERMRRDKEIQEKPEIQRMCPECEEEKMKGVEKMQAPEKEEEELVQSKGEGTSATASSSLSSQIESSSGKGNPLPSKTQDEMQSSFGTDFSHVNVHTDSEAVEMNKELHAQAFTHGNDIYFNSGKFAPESSEGKHLLAHELTHVVQQNNLIQKKETNQTDECPGYTSGEISKSRTSDGFLSNDVLMNKPGELLIADYGNDWGSPKESAVNDPLLKYWLNVFETDPSYRISIIGYSDCIGDSNLNIPLRHRRAKKIEALLGPAALSRLEFRGMAALGQYITDNTTVEGRAKNRGVIIRFYQEINMEPIDIKANPFCGPESTQWLIDQMNANKDHPVIKTNREDTWARYIPFFNLGWTYGFLSDFKYLVKAGGPWDFKSKKFWRNETSKICPSKECDKTVTICGHCLNYDVPGNIHYGFVGSAGGIRRWLLHNRAAAAQKGGVDDPKDSVAIDIGVRMWDQGTYLCEEINSNIGKLNAEGTKECTLCGVKLI